MKQGKINLSPMFRHKVGLCIAYIEERGPGLDS